MSDYNDWRAASIARAESNDTDNTNQLTTTADINYTEPTEDAPPNTDD